MPQTIRADDAGEMNKIVAEDVAMRKLADGFRFIEGPVWVRDRLIFSDIPNNRMHVFQDGETRVYRDPSHNANGNTLDPGGHLVTCEHGTRVVSVTEPALGGERRVLVETFDHDGKPTKFNSPNDVVPGPDDSLYFTDPYWGLPFRERHQFQEYGNDNCWVFRIDNAGKATPIIKEMKRPNGLAFSPDRKTLYVADDEIKHIKAFAVAADGSVSGGRVFCEIDQGVPDGIRVDREGRLYSTAADGVHVFLPDGTRIGKLLCPEGPANCEFGGADGKTLFLTAKTGLYAIDLLVPGDGRGS